jgi:hypothetical protein
MSPLDEEPKRDVEVITSVLSEEQEELGFDEDHVEQGNLKKDL